MPKNITKAIADNLSPEKIIPINNKLAKLSKREQHHEMLHDIFVYRMKGFRPYEICDTLSEKYRVSPKTISNEWSRRNEWLSELYTIEEHDNAVEILLAQRDEINKALWDLHENSPNDNVRLGAMNAASKLNKESLEMLQSVGKVSREPDKIEHVGDINYTFNVNILNDYKQIIQDAANEFPETREFLTKRIREVTEASLSDETETSDD